MNIFLRSWNWCRRFRKRCGYGVHSPSDFFLITFVIYERMPFYAYSALGNLRKEFCHLPHYREKVDKLLLRLVNYWQPSLLLEIGTGSGLNTRYMAAGNLKMNVVTWSASIEEEVRGLFSEVPHISYRQGAADEAVQLMRQTQSSDVVMVHIGHTADYRETFEKLIPQVGNKTCFIIGNPYADKAKKQWWKEVVADERTGVTFDLYDIGIVFFDKKRVKEHRVVNFF